MITILKQNNNAITINNDNINIEAKSIIFKKGS